MKPTNAEIFLKVKQWLRYGDEDLRLARHALALSSSCPTRLIAYHSRLLELCAEKAVWPETISNAEELTPFAITTRYPGEDERVTKKEALRAIDIAAKVRKVVRNALKEEGFRL